MHTNKDKELSPPTIVFGLSGVTQTSRGKTSYKRLNFTNQRALFSRRRRTLCEHSSRHVRPHLAPAAGNASVARGSGLANGRVRSGSLRRSVQALLSDLSCLALSCTCRGAGIPLRTPASQDLL